MTERVLILGAAGRDFHVFNTSYRDDPAAEVVGFTATQIPNIESRRYPPELSGDLYPDGVRIYPEADLEGIIARHGVTRVVFAYSDVSHAHVMHLAARAVAAGASFALPGAETMLGSRVPVVAVTATRTGAGKSPTSRKIRRLLVEAGKRTAVIRHPMPYGELARQRVQRFASYEDFETADCTIEEREEYEPYVEEGSVIFAGADYQAILEAAEAEADVILWDGGNNDLPFLRPTVHLCLVDPHRAAHGTGYWPGEANLRRADVAVVTKVDSAPREGIEAALTQIAEVNPIATVIRAEMPIEVDDPEIISGKRVLVIEDGPTLTHGDMAYGAGALAARRHGATELIDPRPFATGTIATTYQRFPHIGPVLPAMGYGEQQQHDLADTVERAKPDAVVVGTPLDLMRLLDLTIPHTRVFYGVAEVGSPTLADALRDHAITGPND